MDMVERHPVNGDVFSPMSVLVHDAALALVQGISLGFFFSHFFFLQVSGRGAGYG